MVRLDVKLTYKDNGLRSLNKKMDAFVNNYFVEAGILDTKDSGKRKYKTDNGRSVDIITIARNNEFGYSFTPKKNRIIKNKDGSVFRLMANKKYTIPARPAFRRSAKGKYFRSISKKVSNRVDELFSTKKRNVYTTWKDIGEILSGVIKESYTDSDGLAKNSPMTVAIKGSNNPLTETGQVYNAIKYKVKRKQGNK